MLRTCLGPALFLSRMQRDRLLEAGDCASYGICRIQWWKRSVGELPALSLSLNGLIACKCSGPQFWHIGQDPPYRDGFLACIICFSCAIALFIILRLYYIRENRRRDVLQAGLTRSKEPDFSDLTDTEVRLSNRARMDNTDLLSLPEPVFQVPPLKGHSPMIICSIFTECRSKEH